MPLTAVAVKNAKGRDKPYKIADGGGLHLLVSPNGSRYWRLSYRYLGKQKTLALGVFPTVSLSEAREKRDEAKKLLAGGSDPSQRKRIDKLTAKISAENTFQKIAEEYIEKKRLEGLADPTLKKVEWLLSFAYPLIGSRPVSEISAPEVLAVLHTLEKRKRYESARRLRSTCGQVFRYAIATGRAERDPSADLKGALITPKVTHRAAIVEPREVGALLRSLDEFEGQPTTHFALRLAPYLFVRPGELRQAQWQDIDLEARVWAIPEEIAKMRRPHRVPLSKQVIELIRELEPITSFGRYLFPSLRSTRRPISNNTLNAALRRLGYSKDEMTAHGFRAMASTLLNEMGRWHPDAIERQLAHVEGNDVRRAYARGEHWDERVKMMQVWADYLDRLKR